MTRKQIAISVPKDLKDDFYDTAKKLWTNPSNLITMFMSNVVHTKEVHFKAFSSGFEREDFSSSEINELVREWKKSYDEIGSLVD